MKDIDSRKGLEEAYRLQKDMKLKRSELKLLEDRYKNIMGLLEVLDVGRVGDLERVQKVQKRRFIISEKFRALWPEQFYRLAKFTIKDVCAEIPEAVLDQAGALQTQESITWEVISRPDERTWRL